MKTQLILYGRKNCEMSNHGCKMMKEDHANACILISWIG
jgi:hypothetical protein